MLAYRLIHTAVFFSSSPLTALFLQHARKMPISDLLSRRVRAQPEEDDADSDASADDASNGTGSLSSEDEPVSEGSDEVDSAVSSTPMNMRTN